MATVVMLWVSVTMLQSLSLLWCLGPPGRACFEARLACVNNGKADISIIHARHAVLLRAIQPARSNDSAVHYHGKTSSLAELALQC